MLWAYDKAIADDLSRSIDPSSGATDIVKVIDSQGIVGIISQMKEDRIRFPLICLKRNDVTVDMRRWNFAAAKKGIPTTFETDSRNVYLEKTIPINLSYTLYVLTLNTVDCDEIIRELIFKYSNMFFLSLIVPYESKRKIRFGIQMDEDYGVKQDSASFEYQTSGTLYQATIQLTCEGAVEISYTPKHKEVFDTSETEIRDATNLS